MPGVRALVFDYFGVLAQQYGRCDEQVMTFIEQRLLKKYRLAVLSNMNGGSAEAMLGKYSKLFDEVLLSGELGVAKPDERAFLLAARRLGEFPSSCIMVDDSELNCTVAEQVDMRAIRFTNVENLAQKLEKYGILSP